MGPLIFTAMMTVIFIYSVAMVIKPGKNDRQGKGRDQDTDRT